MLQCGKPTSGSADDDDIAVLRMAAPRLIHVSDSKIERVDEFGWDAVRMFPEGCPRK